MRCSQRISTYVDSVHNSLPRIIPSSCDAKPQHTFSNRARLDSTEALTSALFGRRPNFATDACYSLPSTAADGVKLGSPSSGSTHPRIRLGDGEQGGSAGEEEMNVLREIRQAGTKLCPTPNRRLLGVARRASCIIALFSNNNVQRFTAAKLGPSFLTCRRTSRCP